MPISYSVETTEVKPFTYKKPLVSVNEDGELNVHYSKNEKSHIHIKRITFLNLVGRDNKDKIVSYEPLHQVNEFLMAHHIDNGKLESDQYSRGLVHYFSFLIALQEQWDEEYDEDLYQEGFDEPRPQWDFFPAIKSNRITYKYRKALKDSVLNEPDESSRLARTTATAYMNVVINFYKFHLRKGHQFNNPPFDHEVVTLYYKANSDSMKPYLTKDIHTTDLRLNFPQSSRNDGGIIESYRRDLRPLSHQEWQQVENIFAKTKRVIKSVNGEIKLTALAEEYSLMFMVCRFTGMRREEVASLHCGQIVNPSTTTDDNGKTVFDKPLLEIGIGGQYGSLTKTKNGGNKSRRTIIPSALMYKLFEYTRSDRYAKRLDKFCEYCTLEKNKGNHALFLGDDAIDDSKEYLFINARGIPFFHKLNELNSRWVEVRNTVNENLDVKMEGSIHNLRSTFAVNLFLSLLKKIESDKALSYVSSVLGHEDLKTTLEYLKIAENLPTGDEIYEDVLDWVGVFDDLDGIALSKDL